MLKIKYIKLLKFKIRSFMCLYFTKSEPIFKTNTARKIKERFPILKKHYWGTDSLWSAGYFVSTVGITTDTIKRYIAKQGDLDTGQTATLFD